MSRRATEIVLARRLSQRKGERRGGMLVIATISVAVSMAVMLVSMSVIGGFKSALEEILTGFAAHVRVEVLQAANVQFIWEWKASRFTLWRCAIFSQLTATSVTSLF